MAAPGQPRPGQPMMAAGPAAFYTDKEATTHPPIDTTSEPVYSAVENLFTCVAGLLTLPSFVATFNPLEISIVQ